MSTSEPKELQNIEKIDACRSEGGSEKDATSIYNAHMDVSGVDDAKLVRKIDWWLIPWLSTLYLLTFLDRMSIGNAKVRRQSFHFRPALMDFQQLYNLEGDLRLSDKQYLFCLTIFYFSYAFFGVRPNSSRGSPPSFERILIGSE